MNLNAIIGTALGLAFVYLLLSLVCSTIQEWIAGILRRRAANLREGILALLHDQNAVTTLYQDPLLQSMMARGIFTGKEKARSLAYLPADRFTDALLNKFAPAALAPAANIEAALNASPALPAALKESLVTLARRAAGDRDRFLELVQKWFDDTMDRVSGWYKREAQLIIIVIATIVTVAVNVNTVTIARKLYADPNTRENVSRLAGEWLQNHYTEVEKTANTVAVTEAIAQETQNAADAAPEEKKHEAVNAAAQAKTAAENAQQEQEKLRAQYDEAMNTLAQTNLPMYWQAKDWPAFQEEFTAALPGALPGWILTIVALSLGAPFWFDVLMKIANLRTNGPKPAKKSEV